MNLDLILQEIGDTEKNYANDLKVTKEEYSDPLLAQNIISTSQYFQIFSNWDGLIILHQRMVEMMFPLNLENVVQALLFLLKNCSIYHVYVTHHHERTKMLAYLYENNKKFKIQTNFVMDTVARLRQLNLSSFLIKPMGRICKYPLLVRELLRSLPADNPYHARVSAICDGLQEEVNTFNHCMRISETLRWVRERVKSIPDDNLVILKLCDSLRCRVKTKESEFVEQARVILLKDFVVVCRSNAPEVYYVFGISDIALPSPDSSELNQLILKNSSAEITVLENCGDLFDMIQQMKNE